MTEYYGNPNNRRVKEIGDFSMDEINNPTTPIGFIKAKEMLMEYALKFYHEGTIRVGRPNFKGAKYFKGAIHPYEDNSTKFGELDDTFQKIEYNGQEYLCGKEPCGIDKECFVIYQEMPLFINDDMFKWRDNPKYKALETTITDGPFEYHIIARESGDAYVEIRYNKCENKHRNKVTMANVTVYNASNEAILEAIRAWKAEFMEDIEK